MLMNGLEKWMMNHPVRGWIQRYYAAPIFERLGGSLVGKRVLELGCGNGLGVEILLDHFGAAHVDAFDLDPGLVQLAERRLGARRASRSGTHALWVGSAMEVPKPDGHYDAVVAFGVLHHLPDWRAALGETRRVLRPKGRLWAEESLTAFITHPFWSRVLEHPQKDRFDSREFQEALARADFELLGARVLPGESVGWYVAERR